jgi:pilus assembly protein Flp/PilA
LKIFVRAAAWLSWGGRRRATAKMVNGTQPIPKRRFNPPEGVTRDSGRWRPVLANALTKASGFLRHGLARRRSGALGEEADQMSLLLQKFVRDESGATAIEYGLIASLIALVIIGAVGAVGNKLMGTFNEVTSNLH